MIGANVKLVERAKNEMASNWQSLNEFEDPELPEEIRNRFVGAWMVHRSVFGYSLLDELPFRLLRALEDHHELLVPRFDYLVVDEYQDLNQCELSMLKQITHRGTTLVGVGDDDQSIYGFRRAHPIGIQRFISDDYPEAEDYPLSISQRCSTISLTWARHVIEGLPIDRRETPSPPQNTVCRVRLAIFKFPSHTAEERSCRSCAALSVQIMVCRLKRLQFCSEAITTTPGQVRSVKLSAP